jgi:cytochrome P450
VVLRMLIGNENLLTGENETHTRHRRLINPVFQHQNLNSMISMMVQITSCFLDKWAQCASREKDKTITIDVREAMSRLTLDILAGCVFGMSITNDEDMHETVYRSVTVIFNEIEKRLFNLIAILPLVNRLPVPSKLRIDKSTRDLRRVVQRIIDERKKGATKSTAKGSIRGLCFLYSIHT